MSDGVIYHIKFLKVSEFEGKICICCPVGAQWLNEGNTDMNEAGALAMDGEGGRSYTDYN